jgi:Protein of unknown function (DUF3224)
MTGSLETTIKIDSWEEQPTAEFDDGTKVAHAVVGLVDASSGGDEGLRSGHLESVLYYRKDGTSSYVGVLRLEAVLGGRAGALTAIGEGGYDGTTASSTMQITEGTGDLAGITGTVSSSSTHDDYPDMPLVIAYELG